MFRYLILNIQILMINVKCKGLIESRQYPFRVMSFGYGDEIIKTIELWVKLFPL
jgi:hypothetical protein